MDFHSQMSSCHSGDLSSEDLLEVFRTQLQWEFLFYVRIIDCPVSVKASLARKRVSHDFISVPFIEAHEKLSLTPYLPI